MISHWKTRVGQQGSPSARALDLFPPSLPPLIAAVLITHFGGISVDGIRPLYWLQFLFHSVLFLFIVYRLTEIRRVQSPSTSGFVGEYIEILRSSAFVKKGVLFSALSMFTVNMVTPF